QGSQYRGLPPRHRHRSDGSQCFASTSGALRPCATDTGYPCPSGAVLVAPVLFPSPADPFLSPSFKAATSFSSRGGWSMFLLLLVVLALAGCSPERPVKAKSAPEGPPVVAVSKVARQHLSRSLELAADFRP